MIIPSLKKFRRAVVTIRIGKPIGPFASTERGRAGRAEIDLVGETILRAIGELIPPEVRGVYSDDPLLRQAAEADAVYPWASGKFVRNREQTERHKRTKEGAS